MAAALTERSFFRLSCLPGSAIGCTPHPCALRILTTLRMRETINAVYTTAYHNFRSENIKKILSLCPQIVVNMYNMVKKILQNEFKHQMVVHNAIMV